MECQSPPTELALKPREGRKPAVIVPGRSANFLESTVQKMQCERRCCRSCSRRRAGSEPETHRPRLREASDHPSTRGLKPTTSVLPWPHLHSAGMRSGLIDEAEFRHGIAPGCRSQVLNFTPRAKGFGVLSVGSHGLFEA